MSRDLLVGGVAQFGGNYKIGIQIRSVTPGKVADFLVLNADRVLKFNPFTEKSTQYPYYIIASLYYCVAGNGQPVCGRG